MEIIEESVQKMEEIVRDTGCDDGTVILRRCEGTVNCQFERGVCIEACYGGRIAEFRTDDPVEATMRISFMFGSQFPTPRMKSAACAILNVLASFFCLARGVRACPEQDHAACRTSLHQRLADKRVFPVGNIPLPGNDLSLCLVTDPAAADVILVNNEGLVTDQLPEIIRSCRGEKEILCIGPSTAGFASVEQIERFCPYGT